MSDNDSTPDKDLPPWLQAVPDDIDDGASKLTGRRALILTGGLSALVVMGFVSLIVYFGSGSLPEGEIPHIAASVEPYRQKPADPGGMPVPHQDKIVLEAAAGQGAMDAASSVGDQPEQPVDDIASAIAKPKPVETLLESKGDASNGALAGKTKQTPADVKTVTDDATPKKAQVKPGPAPAKKPADAVPAAESSAKQVPLQAENDPASFDASKDFAVQLGAFSQQASATAAWRRARNALPELLRPLKPDYQSIVSGGRTLIRLRTAPFATRASADEACLAIRAKDLACIVVPPVTGGR